LALAKDESWIKDSLCIEYPDVEFFPDETYKEDVKKAKSICSRCLVKSECLDYAYTTNQPWGIWGGFTMKEVRIIAPLRNSLKLITTPVSIVVNSVSITPKPFVLRVPLDNEFHLSLP